MSVSFQAIILFSVHRRPGDALDASRDEGAQREVVGRPVSRQQDLHLHLR